MADYYVREEDGTSKFILEDSSGDYLLETSAGPVTPDFIASVTAVYAPTVGFTGSIVLSTPGTYTWICPSGVTTVDVQCYGGGGGGGNSGVLQGVGGGGGAYAERVAVPVTPGTAYTFIVGTPGAGQPLAGSPTNGANSTFTGDSSVQVIAAGGTGGNGNGTGTAGGAGGQASASTGDTGLKHSGGNGGAGGGFSGPGGGGGASGNALADGANGSGGGGAGSGGGGAGFDGGGSGGDAIIGTGNPGGIPGGGGGGGLGTNQAGNAGGNGQVTINVITATDVVVPYLPSVSVVHAPTLSSTDVRAPFISSNTHVYQPTLKVAFTGGGVSQVALEVLTSNTDAKAYVSQVTLEIIVPWYKGLHIWQKTGQTGG